MKKQMEKVLICKKIGMTEIIQEDGAVVPVTVLEPLPNAVVSLRSPEDCGYAAIQVGFNEIKEEKCSKPHLGQFKKKGVDVFRQLKEFRVGSTDGYEVGKALTLDQFETDDVVGVTGNSKGRGFAGTIKRWNFRRGPMSHGSKSHRITGSIGGGTTPGRVLKGKKMAGRYGNKTTTIMGLRVVKVDQERNVLMVKGAVPGHNNAQVVVAA